MQSQGYEKEDFEAPPRKQGSQNDDFFAPEQNPEYVPLCGRTMWERCATVDDLPCLAFKSSSGEWGRIDTDGMEILSDLEPFSFSPANPISEAPRLRTRKKSRSRRSQARSALASGARVQRAAATGAQQPRLASGAQGEGR